LFLSSDGLVDQNNPSRKKFGTKRLITLLEAHTQATLEASRETIEQELDDFMEGAQQRDDITLMAIKV